MKKIVMFVIVLTMGVALLAGCGSAEQGKKSIGTASVSKGAVNADVAAPAANAGAKTSDGKYEIYVLDAETEEPVTGVKVQFCSDTQCLMGKTDDKGCAVFDEAPGNYTAHVLKAPEGYEKTDEELALTKTEHTAVFKLSKAK